ncbi:NUDIX hydrolase [Kitasatospora sp. NPDC056076]|uniref:NUDIX hydrolase n=1 Tax=Kitasatospora sp. NPDC056076 TaxID=3345703 RepID=UPI0035DAD8EB
MSAGTAVLVTDRHGRLLVHKSRATAPPRGQLHPWSVLWSPPRGAENGLQAAVRLVQEARLSSAALSDVMQLFSVDCPAGAPVARLDVFGAYWDDSLERPEFPGAVEARFVTPNDATVLRFTEHLAPVVWRYRMGLRQWNTARGLPPELGTSLPNG